MKKEIRTAVRRIRSVFFIICAIAAIGSSIYYYFKDNAHAANENMAEANVTRKDKDGLSELEIHFLDVGQGDSTLILCDGHAMLIDAGENDKGSAIQLYLTKQGVTSLDYMIGTHPDSDHIGGMDVILTKFDCKQVMMPDYEKDTRTFEDVILAMQSKNYRNTLPVVGDSYQLGDADFTIIAPNNYSYGDESNNYSIGILLKHGDNTFLFTGDAEEEAERDIVANGIDIDADVLQAGHHGSRTSSSDEFLNVATPEYIVISCGEGNDYGHPHAETLNKYRSMGIKVFRTDEQGTIVATSNGNEIGWNMSPSETWQSGE